MAKLQFRKVLQLPIELTPNTVYLVASTDSANFEIYVTDDAGQAVRHTGAHKRKIKDLTTDAVVDRVPTRIFGSAKWIIQVDGEGNNVGKRAVMEVMALHNGHQNSDASFLDFTVFAKLKTDPMDGVIVTVELMVIEDQQFMILKASSANFPVTVAVTREDLLTL